MNQQPNTTNADSQTAPAEIRLNAMIVVPTPPVLRWWADADGVHLFAVEGKASRAAVFPEIPGLYEWVASGPNGRVLTDTAPALERAKAAAESAVAEMDGEIHG